MAKPAISSLSRVVSISVGECLEGRLCRELMAGLRERPRPSGSTVVIVRGFWRS